MKIALIVLALVAAVVVGALTYMGAFGTIDIAERDAGPFTLVYRELPAGNLGKVGEITTALNAMLESQGIARRKPLDVFLPDGSAQIGFAIEGASSAELAGLAEKARVRAISSQRCMVTAFPWRNPLSFMVGYFKVDPAFAGYRTLHGYAKGEAWALNDGHVIVYMQPIARP